MFFFFIQLTGHKAMIGLFRSQHGHVTRARLRAMINTIRLPNSNPPRRTIFRRRDRVKGSLSVMHVAGHHKLIRQGNEDQDNRFLVLYSFFALVGVLLFMGELMGIR